jgi:hypothetical protein
MTAARLTTHEAAELLGLTPVRMRGIARRRGWQADGDTWPRADVDAELRERARLIGRVCAGSVKLDGFTKEGAERLADTIREHWAKRGKHPNVWIEPANEYLNAMRTGAWYVVRSNLRNGLPPRG